MKKVIDRLLGMLLFLIYVFMILLLSYLSSVSLPEYGMAEYETDNDYGYSEGLIFDGVPLNREFDFGCLDQQEEMKDK